MVGAICIVSTWLVAVAARKLGFDNSIITLIICVMPMFG
jgi:hypothetical protein